MKLNISLEDIPKDQPLDMLRNIFYGGRGGARHLHHQIQSQPGLPSASGMVQVVVVHLACNTWW